MIVEDLLEKIDSSMFEGKDFDEILDLRDEAVFDRQWVRVYETVKRRKAEKEIDRQEEKLLSQCRETAYRKVYELCEDSDLAAYISDDFGLIGESELTEYQEPWLDRLIQKYKEGQIPRGRL